VRKKLGELADDQTRNEIDGDDARREVAPLWRFQILKRGILGEHGSHAHEATRIGDDKKMRHLVRIGGKTGYRLLLLEDGKSIAEYPLEPGWTAHMGLTMYRDGKTFVPVSRSVGHSVCQLILLERNKKNRVLVKKKMRNDWIQPVGLLWRRDELLFLVASGRPDVGGISRVDVASLRPNKLGTESTEFELLLRASGLQIWWIGAVHAHGDEVRAIIDTNRGVRVCKLFCRA